jgi:hypothetical protein
MKTSEGASVPNSGTQSQAALDQKPYRMLRLIVLVSLLAIAVGLGCAGVLRREHWVHPEISGIVRDSATSAPMPGVTVTVIDSDYHTFEAETQLDGSFYIPPVRAPKFWHRQLYVTRLRIQKHGYYTERAETWHGYEEVRGYVAAPERYLKIEIERQEDESKIAKRDTILFHRRGWTPPTVNNFKKARKP